ncbi:C1 family peptidase [Pseudomonas cedrina]|uniref:C1 family peptidase n=1 Tax=Pseudomonas cedrina TaxID=651740 RepID=UPI0027D827EF|nr:C1 family peptidase [Pseudomonas cedrina]
MNELIRLPEADITVRAQGLRPTCLAFALSDLNYQLASDHLSPEYLYRAAALASLGWQPNDGMTWESAVAAVKTGQPLEEKFPYQSTEPPVPIPALPRSLALHRNAISLQSNKFDEIVIRLQRQIPTGLALRLTQEFYSPQNGQVLFSDRVIPGMLHAVVVIGHGTTPDSKQWLFIRNSWGSPWGDGNGRAWICESYVAAHSTFAFGVN